MAASPLPTLRVAPSAAALALLATAAQGAQQPAPSLAGLATVAQVQAVLAAMPTPCAAVPAADTLAGSLGTAAPCTPRQDASRPTVVQAANVVTDPSGNWSVTWAKPFASPSPTVAPLPVNTGTLPVLCNVGSRSATTASGRCWQANTATLGGTLAAIVGAVVNSFQNGAANMLVSVIAREPTQ